MIPFQRKKNFTLLALALPSLLMTSCGKANGLDTLALEEGGSISYQFGEAFHAGSIGIYHSGDKITDVTSDMLVGFYTNVLSFDQDLTATVVYQKLRLPLTYRVSSTYSLDQAHFTVEIQQ